MLGRRQTDIQRTEACSVLDRTTANTLATFTACVTSRSGIVSKQCFTHRVFKRENLSVTADDIIITKSSVSAVLWKLWKKTNQFITEAVNNQFCCLYWASVVYGLAARNSGCYPRGPAYDSRLYKIFWVAMGLERGPLSPCESKWGATWKKSSGSGLENWD
jgi:hypothetical protein